MTAASLAGVSVEAAKVTVEAVAHLQERLETVVAVLVVAPAELEALVYVWGNTLV